MSVYINRHSEQHLDDSFDEFKTQHGLDYESELEHRQRSYIFRNNVRYVNTRNRAGLSYKMKINKFADRTVRENLFRFSCWTLIISSRMMNYVYFVVDDILKVTMVVFHFLKKN